MVPDLFSFSHILLGFVLLAWILNSFNSKLFFLTVKDKEQYKLDIVDLKAKISMCCGQEQDPRGQDAEAQSSVKLERQLQDMEERLVRTQEMLDDATHERDTYKAKVMSITHWALSNVAWPSKSAT